MGFRGVVLDKRDDVERGEREERLKCWLRLDGPIVLYA